MSFRTFLPFTPENVNNFQLALSEMIQYSAGIIQVGVDGEQFQNEYAQRCVIAANLAMLEMQAKGLIITSYRVGYLFVRQGQADYVIEDEHSTNAYTQNQIATTVTSGNTFTLSAAVNSQVVVPVLPGDYVGLTLDTGDLFWTKCASFSSPTLVTTDSMPSGSSISAGQYVLNYTNQLRQISRVHQVWRRDGYVNNVPINMISQQEYDVLPNHSVQGIPSQALYKRDIPKGVLQLWAAPQNSMSIIGFWYESKLGQLRYMTDVIDLDQFYYPAFSYLLALRLCDVFGVNASVKASIERTASLIMADALSFDDEVTPVKISPNRRT